jgi:D-aminopeptidase
MQPGFRVFIIPDMEGLASVMFNRDITAGNETSTARENPLYPFTHDDYWDHYRDIATREVNAAISGTEAPDAALNKLASQEQQILDDSSSK